MKKKIYSDLAKGDKFSFTKTITQQDINTFAGLSGDHNPIHLQEEFAKNSMFKGIVAHGMLTASYTSTVLSDNFEDGTTYLGVEGLNFIAPVRPDDTITTNATISYLHPNKPIIKLDIESINQNDQTVMKGTITAMVPTSHPVKRPGANI